MADTFSFESALRLAKKLCPAINYCMEYTDAYVFSEKEDMSFGGNSPVVILKSGGKAVNMTSYIDTSDGELIREFSI